MLDHVAQRHVFTAEEKAGADNEIEVLFAEAQLAQTQERLVGAVLGQRVDLGDAVAERAVGVNKAIDARLQQGLVLGARSRFYASAVGPAQLEAFEKRGPARIDSSGILAPA